MKVILNKCFGGFGFSSKAVKLYAEKKGVEVYPYQDLLGECVRCSWDEAEKSEWYTYYLLKDFGPTVRLNEFDYGTDVFRLDRDEIRNDPAAVEVVEELGEKANGRYAHLVVADIPDGMKYVIDDYDGVETLHEDVPCW